MKKRILASIFVFLFVVVFSSFAQEKVVGQKQVTIPKTATVHSTTLAWTAPTTCTDGTACTPSGYNVYKAVSTCPATGTPTGATKIASAITTTTFVDTPLAPGTYCYYVTALNSAGESTASNTAQGVLAQPAMAAPTNFTAVIQ